MAVALVQGDLDGLGHFVGFALPGAEADRGDLLAGIEGEGLPGKEINRIVLVAFMNRLCPTSVVC